MKKLLFALAAVAAMTASFAEDTQPQSLAEINERIDKMLEEAPKGPHGGKLISPELKELMDRRSGGLVAPKTNGRSFLLVDARGAKDDFLDEYVIALKRQFHIAVTPVVNELPENADLFAFANGLKTKMSPAVIMIVDLAGKPTLNVYPEDAVGIVNAAPLKTDNETLYRERLSKEVWRGIALSLGGFATAAPNGRIVKSILSPVYNVRDLDNLKIAVLSPNQCNAVYESVSSIGLQAAKPVVYSVACRQGWAPAPTNDIQRAIWEKTKAEQSEKPSNPIKIRPGDKPKAK